LGAEEHIPEEVRTSEVGFWLAEERVDRDVGFDPCQ